MVRISGGILDGASHKPCFGSELDRLGDYPGSIAKTLLEIRRNRQLCCADDQPRMRQCFVPCDSSVFFTKRRSTGCARCRQRLKPEAGEKPGRWNVPGIRNNKDSRSSVKCFEERCSFALRCMHIPGFY